MEYHLLSELIHRRATVFGDKEVIKNKDKKTGQWHSVSWKEFSDKINKLAEVLADFGIKEEDKIGVYSQNMEQCLVVDFATFCNRAITTPMYATSSIPQIKYIIEEAEVNLLFVGEQFQYDNAYSVLKEKKILKQIVIFDPEVKKASDDTSSVYFDEFLNRPTSSAAIVQKRKSEASADDVVHIIYTSGTTGEPKGVILKNSNYTNAMKIHDERLAYLPKEGISMCFLPLTHIFEKAWSIYCLHRGYSLAINLDPREIQTTIKEIKPSCMCSVPRFWEKVYAGVQEKIESSSPLIRKIFLHAIKTGKEYVFEYRNKGIQAPWWLKTKFNFYNKTVYQALKKAVGIENGTIYPCAGAPLSDNINIFIQSVNIPLIYGYGLTETTATVSCFVKTGFTIGTVGKVMSDTKVRIGENNEILVRGGSVMFGYYKKPKETAAVFTEDGFLKTGDAGYLTENNEIAITERIKDLYKTSNGKYIAPQQIETRLAEDKYIDVVAAIGDQRKYVTALIVPAFDELKIYAKENAINYKNMEDLCALPEIYQLLESRIKPLLVEFANFEQIKKFTIIPRPFTIDSGELTNTLKLKRSFLLEKYKKEIEEMYN